MRLQQPVVDGLDPCKLLVIVNIETITGAREHDAVVTALHQRLFMEEVEHTAQALRLLFDFAIIAERADREHDRSDQDPDDGDND